MRHKCLFPGLWLALGIIALALGEALGVTSGSADPLPIKIAVFDFELDDLSAGGGIAGDTTEDAAQLNQAAEKARLLMAQSGRYSLVDISATDDDVKSHRLRQCDGCEAAIARKLGAEQSFLGVVTRISRTEYVVRFQIRDAHSGELVLAPQSGLRMGADYSWDRGTASLIRSGLLHQ